MTTSLPAEDSERGVERFFEANPEGLALFRTVEDAVAELGAIESRVTKSQIAFRSRKAFAFVWCPGQYVTSDVPAVLSIALPRLVSSDRFKEVAHPSSRVWIHHLELRDSTQIDDEVRGWLAEAFLSAS